MENNRSFHLYFAEGQTTQVEDAWAEPDVVLSISAFSALISGVCDFAGAAEWMDGVEVRRQADALPRVFYPKPLMIADYF